jgi:hypothetical protein
MAVFTAIATAIVGAIGITGVLATIATSVIAGGLAYGTARALGVFKAPELDQGRDPGVSIQLPPATDNKIPILYGQAFTSGPIFDAAISNQNKTMTYCIALSEQTQTGTFTCDQVFMNDVELIFTGNTVTSHKDPNQSSDTSYAGNVRLNVYAGGSGSGDVIFPTSGTGSTTAATSIVPHWGANHTANALVFAVLQIDYDAENGLTGLPQMTFKMNNTLNNPGDVLYDYLTSTRYGAKLSNAEIDVNSITGTSNVEMKGYCDELVAYTNKANVSTTNKRYQINGMLSTFDSCSTNIDKICQASATFFTFNVKEGKFAAIPNRAISTAEKANCLVYNDDNIVSKIDISSTELYALYNGVEIEFMDQNRKDQTNTVLVETPAGDRNANEPDNVLKYKIDMINDNVRAERLANIDLNQSRVGTVIQFDADYSGIQTDVGDVIKVTNNLYGWTDKLFRVMRVTEISSDTGIVTARISAIEYSDDYYTNPASTETPDLGVIDLPRIPVIRDIPIVKAFQGSYSNVAALPNVYGDIIPNQAMKTFGAGVQIEDANLSNTNVVYSPYTGNVANTFIDLLDPPAAYYDLTDSDIGDYSFDAVATPGGKITGAYDLGFQSNGNVLFANATTQVSLENIGGGGQIFTGFTTPATTLVSQTKFSTDPTTHGLSSDFKAISANIRLTGFSSLDDDSANGFPRAFSNMKYQVVRVTKGEK